MNYLLGTFGPWQIMVIAVLPILLIVGLILLFVSRAKHKTRDEMLDKQLKEKKKKETKQKI